MCNLFPCIQNGQRSKEFVSFFLPQYFPDSSIALVFVLSRPRLIKSNRETSRTHFFETGFALDFTHGI